MGSFLQDLRYGFRMLGRNPGFAAIVVAILAVAIGSNTAIFSFVNAILLQPLPYRQPGGLVQVREALPKLGFDAGTFSAPDYENVARENDVFGEMAAYQNRDFELSGIDRPQQVTGLRASASLFPLLGIEPALGRWFTHEEDSKLLRVAILSYKLWASRFGANRNIIGKPITLDRRAYVVVGVMPLDFAFPERGSGFNTGPADVFVPMSFTPDELQGFGTGFNNTVIARLKPNVTLNQAQSECRLILRRFESQYPAVIRQDPNFELSATVVSLRQALTGRTSMVLLVLLAAIGMVLLIACADVSNLLLARATTRQREMAIRTALGAARSRLVRQVLTESFILSIAGGGVGLLLAHWATKLLVTIVPGNLPRTGEIRVDTAVIGFAFGLCTMTALLFGLAPALNASRTGVNECLKQAGRSGTSSPRQRRVLGALAAGQLALSLMLLIGAGLLIRSFVRLLATDPGFRPEHVLSLSTTLPGENYPKAFQIRSFYQRLLDSVGTLPGVEAAGEATVLPLHSPDSWVFTAERDLQVGQAASSPVAVTWILGDYFNALRVPLIKGRFLAESDTTGTAPVVVINEAMARRFWRGRDPIGHRIKWGVPQSHTPWMAIVGVVGNIKNGPLSSPAQPAAYAPFLQVLDELVADQTFGEFRTLHLIVRTGTEPASITNSIRRTINQLDPSLPVSNVETMEDVIHGSVKPQQFNVLLVAAFGGMALLLAIIGIYGVVSYTTRQRTHEIGIRMALGAKRTDIVKLVLTEAMLLALVGVAAGILGALGLTRYLQGMLYDVQPSDPKTFGAASMFLAAVALAAAYIPARRATKVDPMVALRYE